MRTLPGQIFQMTLRGLARWHRLVGILVFELIQRKRDAASKPHGFRDRLRHIAKQAHHFIRGLEIAFRICFKTLANGIDGHFLANAGENILQRAARGMVIQHLVGRQQRHAGGCGNALEPHKTALVVAAVQQAGCKPHTIRAAALQLIENLKRFLRLEAMRQRQNQKLPFGKFQEVIELQMTFALIGIIPSLAAG